MGSRLGAAFGAFSRTELPDEDRAEFASELLGRPVYSWSSLSDRDVTRLVRCVEVWHRIETMRGHRSLTLTPKDAELLAPAIAELRRRKAGR